MHLDHWKAFEIKQNKIFYAKRRDNVWCKVKKVGLREQVDDVVVSRKSVTPTTHAHDT